jgi:hypothetical protein
MSQSQPTPPAQDLAPQEQAVLTDAANLPFSQVVKFAQAFGISLEDLSKSLGRSEQSLAASVVRSEDPRSTNATDERVSAENARNSQDFNQREQQHQAQQHQEAKQQRSAQSAAQQDAGQAKQPQTQPESSTPQSDTSTSSDSKDAKIDELQRRLEKLEASIGSDQANRLGDPSGQPKAQQFRELPVRDALELVFQRMGPEVLEPVLPLEQSMPLINQIHQLRDALARVENELNGHPQTQQAPAQNAPQNTQRADQRSPQRPQQQQQKTQPAPTQSAQNSQAQTPQPRPSAQQPQNVAARRQIDEEAQMRATPGGNAGIPPETQGEARDILLHREPSDSEDESVA